MYPPHAACIRNSGVIIMSEAGGNPPKNTSPAQWEFTSNEMSFCATHKPKTDLKMNNAMVQQAYINLLMYLSVIMGPLFHFLKSTKPTPPPKKKQEANSMINPPHFLHTVLPL